MTDVALVDASQTQPAEHSNLALVLFNLLPVHDMTMGHLQLFQGSAHLSRALRSKGSLRHQALAAFPAIAAVTLHKMDDKHYFRTNSDRFQDLARGLANVKIRGGSAKQGREA